MDKTNRTEINRKRIETTEEEKIRIQEEAEKIAEEIIKERKEDMKRPWIYYIDLILLIILAILVTTMWYSGKYCICEFTTVGDQIITNITNIPGKEELIKLFT